MIKYIVFILFFLPLTLFSQEYCLIGNTRLNLTGKLIYINRGYYIESDYLLIHNDSIISQNVFLYTNRSSPREVSYYKRQSISLSDAAKFKKMKIRKHVEDGKTHYTIHVKLLAEYCNCYSYYNFTYSPEVFKNSWDTFDLIFDSPEAAGTFAEKYFNKNNLKN